MSYFRELLYIARQLKRELKSPYRKYHDINHIFYMWKNFKKYKGTIILTPLDDLAIRLSIWFHDIIYFTDDRYGNNENESISCALFTIADFCDNYIPNQLDVIAILIKNISDMIGGSANHAEFNEDYRNSPIGLFLDLDLLSLADMPNLFKNNANIIAEFDNIDPFVFWSARAKFFGELLTNRFGYFEYYTAQINKDHGEAAETGIMLLLQHAVYTKKQLDLAVK